VCKGKKTTRLKRGRQSDLRPQPPALICGRRNVSSHPRYLGNHAHNSCKSALSPRTIDLACHTYVIPPPCRAWAHSRSTGRSRASVGKNRIWSCICSYSPFMV
jgi:hypothetical protein